ncbi:MAG: hypothetical protein V2I46_07685 [Bacteroides sp.]|jgi:hypothetical protein|nr:hypothetical protein [Bacteroides sp.]
MKTKKSLTAIALLLLVLAGCSKIEIDSRNQFTGRYNVEEFNYTDGGLSYYDVRIRKVAESEDEIVFENFFNAGIDVFGIVVGNRVYIESQTVDIFWIEGQGTLSGNVLNMVYDVVVTLGQSTYDHELGATFTKY